MRVALTGATGFIGAHVARLLVEAGHDTCALVRDARAARPRLDARVTLQQGDLGDALALRQFVTGVDAVVHLAGVVRGSRQAEFDRVNVDGTRRLCEALPPATRLLLMSSLAAREPQLSFYARSKHHAESVARARCRVGQLAILRPPPVYGPGDTEMLPVFRCMARAGFAPVAGDISSRVSLIHVFDLASAVIALLHASGTTDAPYTLHDGKPGGYGWDELCATAQAICGRTIHPRRLPGLALDAIAHANRITSRLLRYAPMLTPEKLRELRHPDWVCDNAAICRDTTWQPTLQLHDGLLATPGWH